MATKSEMEAELAILRSKLGERDTADAAFDTQSGTDAKDSGIGQDPPHCKADFSIPSLDQAKAEFERILAPHGVSLAEIEALANQLWEELDTLPKDKPLITAVGAFALGFLLGRMTK